ncbi:hypothetical protein HJC23_006212 [Cyclotella cryptica]|uniref:Uncharacterized protein n=1 Tax=Cyclotella cryptica TaxID=29204 RepID=A0ABD3Q1Z5_9STRA
MRTYSNLCERSQHNNVQQSLILHHLTHDAEDTRAGAPNPNITFVGISYSDTSLSEAAIEFLLEAACRYNMESYIVLSERDAKFSLDQKIYMLAQHWYLPLGQGGSLRQPQCANLIHISQTPGHREMLNLTMSRMIKTGEMNLLPTRTRNEAPNNPLDPNNRIAKIKRVREYQRQMLRDITNKQSRIFLKRNDSTVPVIAVLDLDMFAYPRVIQIIQTSETHMIPSDNHGPKNGEKFHAICANGLQRSRYWENRPHRNYYDTFSTVLLPNTWLHLESKRMIPRGGLEGENITLAKMSQQEALNWFLSEGTKNHKGTYEPVPVRSCFGGLALYRADVWLHDDCRYDLYNKDLDVYRGKQEQHTCEHIVLHECLRQQISLRIAVQPDLLTLWHLM